MERCGQLRRRRTTEEPFARFGERFNPFRFSGIRRSAWAADLALLTSQEGLSVVLDSPRETQVRTCEWRNSPERFSPPCSPDGAVSEVRPKIMQGPGVAGWLVDHEGVELKRLVADPYCLPTVSRASRSGPSRASRQRALQFLRGASGPVGAIVSSFRSKDTE